MADKPTDPIMPQAVADRQPVGDNMSLRDIQRSMKKDPDGHGISALGYDGVLRTFDNERNVLDAVGLNPAQIRDYYDGLPMPERLLTADGRNISRRAICNDVMAMKPPLAEILRRGHLRADVKTHLFTFKIWYCRYELVKEYFDQQKQGLPLDLLEQRHDISDEN
ncbi:Hypothetical protein NCS54_01501000 [Fusarium falciforme]|uniref:Hypothetical protein n=1 Tax=Fusarium falciforme TaxID=195108 RepID=UPI002301734B|nr:Hypothetical protein NCS54_01501000 [Fusarium falciforme]WAO97288.1 Hypothetical protein NCS54_01501000 [Fusarium falciforme]